MPNTILHKRNSTANSTPPAANLAVGELAINTADGRLFTELSNGTVVNLPVTSISGQTITPSSVTTDQVFSPFLQAKANVYDITEIGTYTVYNTNVLDVDEIGAVAKITGSTGNSPTDGFLLFSASIADPNDGFVAALRDTFGVHPAGVVVDPTGLNTRTNPAVALDVRGSATITAGIVASGSAQTPGIQSPQTGLYLWQNFR